MKGTGLSWAAGRSVTLLRLFLLTTAVLLAAAAVAIASVLSEALRQQAIEDRTANLDQWVGSTLRPHLVSNGTVKVDRSASRHLLADMRGNRDLITVKVWRVDGTLAWTNRDTRRIGKRFPLDQDLAEAIVSKKPSGAIGRLDARGEDRIEARLGFDRVLEVYAPILSADGLHPLGALEIYADPQAVESRIASRKHALWGVVAGVFVFLFGALGLLVRTASRTMARQAVQLRERTGALLESNRQLQESSFQAVQGLNATVDAKDPYTAGHSQRVQEISVAVGKELGLSDDQIDVLRIAGLFHDIGKIGVPDAILTKPDRLTADEVETIKGHPEAGAEIVSHFAGLRAAAPAIRHHHERWDGRGYPDGLEGDQIPIEAAIVGLADTWDAMTTDRPYSRAMSRQEAIAEIRRGQGLQFHPLVVVAFLEAVRKRPHVFEPSRYYAAVAAAR